MKAIIVFLIGFGICFDLVSEAQQVQNIGAVEFSEGIKKQKCIILDVRTPREFNSGYIEGAQNINISDPQFREKVLSFPKDMPIYIYCYSGSRSAGACSFLVQNGYTKVYNLVRGTMAWRAANLPLVTSATPSTSSTNNTLPDFYSLSQYMNLVNNDRLVFIDFYAPWCIPCKEMMPMIMELKNEYEGKIKVEKINTDASKELTTQLQLQSVPYLVLYKNGTIVYKKEGKATKDELKKVFNEALK
ncbi:MAG: thioredoxin domain-containing protein [Bacteroidales bacterium]